MKTLALSVLMAIFTSYTLPSIKTVENGKSYPVGSEEKYSGAATQCVDKTSLYSLAFCSEKFIIKMKFEEGSLDDALMTRKCGSKVVRLAQLVEKEWKGKIYLRITEAFDTEAEHEKYSLHFEGRAVDVTTSDKDKSKYARLGGLAIEAGFNWIKNEGDHIHASVKK